MLNMYEEGMFVSVESVQGTITYSELHTGAGYLVI